MISNNLYPTEDAVKKYLTPDARVYRIRLSQKICTGSTQGFGTQQFENDEDFDW